jgi:hypothetical protein
MNFLSVGQQWSPADIPNRSFLCGFCNITVSSVKGFPIYYQGKLSGCGGYICPNCSGLVFLSPDGQQFPSPSLGNQVSNVPKELYALYEEARRCTSHNAYTAAVLLCRKMLMNISVSQGAAEGLKFFEYVNFLSVNNYIPPNGKHWVDHIRRKGNEATHEISIMTEQDARELIAFVEMLLRFIYEFPSMVPVPST